MEAREPWRRLFSGRGSAGRRYSLLRVQFIAVSIAGLADVTEREAGLASGLLNTSQQPGGNRRGYRVIGGGHPFANITRGGVAASAALTGVLSSSCDY